MTNKQILFAILMGMLAIAYFVMLFYLSGLDINVEYTAKLEDWAAGFGADWSKPSYAPKHVRLLVDAFGCLTLAGLLHLSNIIWPGEKIDR